MHVLAAVLQRYECDCTARSTPRSSLTEYLTSIAAAIADGSGELTSFHFYFSYL
jgi:hypothetical protein